MSQLSLEVTDFFAPGLSSPFYTAASSSARAWTYPFLQQKQAFHVCGTIREKTKGKIDNAIEQKAMISAIL
tara:strand:- start:222 stop:434 length:213 start_codon:yes stop_codon:yes gene_type:complete